METIKKRYISFQDLRKELGKLWKLKAEVVPVVAVILGTISRYLKF